MQWFSNTRLINSYLISGTFSPHLLCTAQSLQPTLPGPRKAMRAKICDVPCNGEALGYSYCAYRVCSNSHGDFVQRVSKCDAVSATRSVTYTLKEEIDCQYVANDDNAAQTIGCEYTPFKSAYGAFNAALATIGIVVCAVILLLTWCYKNEAVMRGSQLLFVYAFLWGAIAMNAFVVLLLGPVSNTVCMLRPWIFNLSATIM